MFLYSAITSPSDRSFLLEEFSHGAITERRLFTHISTAVVSIARYSFIQLNELGHRGDN